MSFFKIKFLPSSLEKLFLLKKNIYEFNAFKHVFFSAENSRRSLLYITVQFRARLRSETKNQGGCKTKEIPSPGTRLDASRILTAARPFISLFESRLQNQPVFTHVCSKCRVKVLTMAFSLSNRACDVVTHMTPPCNTRTTCV